MVTISSGSLVGGQKRTRDHGANMLEHLPPTDMKVFSSAVLYYTGTQGTCSMIRYMVLWGLRRFSQ